jgi:hypothetical protein
MKALSARLLIRYKENCRHLSSEVDENKRQSRFDVVIEFFRHSTEISYNPH